MKWFRAIVGALRWAWSWIVYWRDVSRVSELLRERGNRSRRTRHSRRGDPPEVKAGANTQSGSRRPEIDRFLDNASNYLFESYGVEAIPAAFWTQLDRTGKPVESFKAFLELLGLDVEAIRRRDEAELSRLRDYCDFLLLVGDDVRFLARTARAELARVLVSEEPEEFRNALGLIAQSRSIIESLDAPLPTSCKAFERWRQGVLSTVRDPFRLGREGLANMLADTQAWRAALAEAAGAVEDARAAESALADAARGEAADRSTKAQKEQASRRLAALSAQIVADATLTPGRLAELTNELREIAELFDSLRNAADSRRAERERRRRQDERRRADQQQRDRERRREEDRRRNRERANRDASSWRRNYGNVDEALRFFGFEPHPRPAWREIFRAFRRMRTSLEREAIRARSDEINAKLRDAQGYFLTALRPNQASFG